MAEGGELMASGCGIDLGHSLVRLAMVDSRKGAHTLKRYLAAAPEGGETPVEAARAVFSGAKRSGSVHVGLTGADLMMRYLPVPAVEDWRLERLMDFEIREIEGRSGSSMASSYNLLPVPKGLDDEDTMLLSLVREDLLDETMSGIPGIAVKAFSPNAIALYNCYLALGDHEQSTTLIASLGKGTLDLALVNGTDLYFARSVTTSLEKRDQTLAAQLGIDGERAKGLIHKHLDLRLATGQRLGTDAERVTRPLLPLYESLPTLLGGVVTLCKAQTRLSELNLDRVLLTGGGANANGLVEFLNDRMRVPVSVWNPAEMIDPSELPEDEADQLEADGPGAAVALGLALSAADPDLYALEILTAAARKKKAFAERGIFNILMGAAAVIFLAVNFIVMGGLADEAATASAATKRTQKALDTSNSEAVELLEQIREQELLYRDLEARFAVNRSAAEFIDHLRTSLPDSLWVEQVRVTMTDGKEWEREDQPVPILQVEGRAEDDVRAASSAFGVFVVALEGMLADKTYLQPSSNPRGKVLEWSMRAQLLEERNPSEEGEEDMP
ncbi:MAG: pilus assembly protein PilM [Planctomycetes bacterium]|nr:pilus assembly protein PilM [Planctomycetota bacterium]